MSTTEPTNPMPAMRWLRAVGATPEATVTNLTGAATLELAGVATEGAGRRAITNAEAILDATGDPRVLGELVAGELVEPAPWGEGEFRLTYGGLAAVEDDDAEALAKVMGGES